MSIPPKYKPGLSRKPSARGRMEITIVPIKSNTPNLGLNDLLEAETQFQADIVEVIEKQIKLKKSVKKERTLETKELYETAEGKIVELVNDQFQGLMVESEDKEIIQKIYQELIKLQS